MFCIVNAEQVIARWVVPRFMVPLHCILFREAIIDSQIHFAYAECHSNFFKLNLTSFSIDKSKRKIKSLNSEKQHLQSIQCIFLATSELLALFLSVCLFVCFCAGQRTF